MASTDHDFDPSPLGNLTIGLFIRPWHTVARDILAGIHEVAQHMNGWSLFAPWPDVSDWRWPSDVAIDAAILDSDTVQETHLSVPPDVPVIVCGQDAEGDVKHRIDVSWNNREVGQLAADHLLEQGFRSLCIVSDLDKGYQLKRREGFAQRAVESDARVTFIDVRSDNVDHLPACLSKLPKPTGAFAASDRLGHFTLRGAAAAGIAVPEALAVVGAGNDELFCEFTNPPLSSVALPGRQCGEVAARLLADALSRRCTSPAVISPDFVAIRHSTDMLAVDDPVVVRSLRLIRDHAAEGLEASDVHERSGVAKRTLEIRFRKVVGRTLSEEIARTRVEYAKRLLRSTQLPIANVAERSGFSSPERLDVVFRRLNGSTPTEYRSTQS